MRKRCREPGGEGRDGVEKDAERQHAAAAEQVGQVAANQADRPAGHHRHPEEQSPPVPWCGPVGAGEQLDKQVPADVLHDEQHIDVEPKTDGREDQDQPVPEGQRLPAGGKVGGHERSPGGEWNTETPMPAEGPWASTRCQGIGRATAWPSRPRPSLRRHDLQQFHRRLLVAVDEGESAIGRPRAVEAEPRRSWRVRGSRAGTRSARCAAARCA